MLVFENVEVIERGGGKYGVVEGCDMRALEPSNELRLRIVETMSPQESRKRRHCIAQGTHSAGICSVIELECQ